MDAYYTTHKIDDDSDGKCYSFAYVLSPTFIADWTPNTMSWTQWFFNTYKKNDNVYGTLGEIMNETETYWARYQRGFFALFYYLILMMWSIGVVWCFFAVTLEGIKMWSIAVTLEGIKKRKKY